jgi:predicted CoA-binding protein
MQEAAEVEAIYGPERYQRLAAIKKTSDPVNMFRLNHNVMPTA